MNRRALVLLGAVLWVANPQNALAVTAVDTAQLRLVFGAQGEMVQMGSCLPDCADPAARPLQLQPEPGVVSFGKAVGETWTVSRKRVAQATVLSFQAPDENAYRRWYIPDSGWRVRLETGSAPRVFLAADPDFMRNDAHGFARLLGRTRYVILTDRDIATVELDETAPTTEVAEQWVGYRNRYWAVLLRPEQPMGTRLAPGPVAQVEIQLREATAPAAAYSLYLGPVEPGALESAAPELQGLLYASLWEPLRWICFGLFHLLQFIHLVVPHWATAIMFLSIAVAVLMWPLSQLADRLQRQVQDTEARLAPRIAAIKAESRGEEQAERLLGMYRSEGVHPLYSLKSMVGIAIVIPVFIGAFDMLAENIWLAGEHFLWIADLARPDSVAALPFSLPFLGDQLNLLPFVMTGLSVWASWLHQAPVTADAPNSPHLYRLFLLALVFLLLFYTFPAGMVLYWTTNNLISVIKSLWARR